METLIYQAHHVKDRNVNNSIQFTHTSITFLQWLLTPSGNRSKPIYKWTLLKIQIRAWSLWLAYEPSSMKIVQSYLCALYLSFHILHHSGPYSLVVPLPPPGTYQHRIQKILDGHSPCMVVLAFFPPSLASLKNWEQNSYRALMRQVMSDLPCKINMEVVGRGNLVEKQMML